MKSCSNCKHNKNNKCMIYLIDKPEKNQCNFFKETKQDNTKIFAHVGLGKCGSTFLQRVIFNRLKNVNYANSDGLRMRIKPGMTNLFSAESLSGRPTKPKIVNYEDRFEIAEKLQRIYPDVNILLVIRDKESLLDSYYKSYIREGGPLNRKDWYEKIFDPKNLDFASYIIHLNRLFKNVKVFYFRDLKKNPDGFVKDVCDYIGCEVPEYPKIKKNVGYNKIQTKVVRLLNHFFKSELNPNGFIPRGKYLNPDTIVYMPHLKKLLSKK